MAVTQKEWSAARAKIVLCGNLRGLNLTLNAEETYERFLSRAEVWSSLWEG